MEELGISLICAMHSETQVIFSSRAKAHIHVKLKHNAVFRVRIEYEFTGYMYE